MCSEQKWVTWSNDSGERYGQYECGYDPEMDDFCGRTRQRIAELEKELRELNALLKDAHKAWDSDKDSRVGKLLHAALNKDFRYTYRPDLKDL